MFRTFFLIFAELMRVSVSAITFIALVAKISKYNARKLITPITWNVLQLIVSNKVSILVNIADVPFCANGSTARVETHMLTSCTRREV